MIRSFLSISIWILSFALMAGSLRGSEKPNILLILTDDQGWPTLGCYGGRHVETPNLDRLAGEGARFTDAYVTSQCTPTRASLLTGQYTARTGLWHVLPWYGYPWARVVEPMFADRLPRETFTIAKGLRTAGYATAIFGKWHLTNDADGNYMGLRPEASHYYGFDFAPPPLGRDAFEEGRDRGVETLTRQTIEFIREHRDQPWFCFLSHHMIHGVVVAPNEMTDKYRRAGYGDEGPNRAVYLAGLQCIDRSVGQLLRFLDESGLADNTLVVFLSDNGGIDQKFDFASVDTSVANPSLRVEMEEYDNAPLRAGKGSTYEGGTRVPMIVRWPASVPAGATITAPVHVVDLLPTFLQAAGAAIPPEHTVDGQSLLTVLVEGNDPSFASRPVFQYYPFYDLRWELTPNASVRIGDYKLIEFFGDRFDQNHRYVSGNAIELYNLRDDLGETRNLAEAQTQRAMEMRDVLHRWLASIPASVPTANSHHSIAEAFNETRERPPWLRDVRWKTPDQLPNSTEP